MKNVSSVTAPTRKQAVHGIGKGILKQSEPAIEPQWKPCACGVCGMPVRQVRNRNGLVKEYFSDKCRERASSRARDIGRQVIKSGLPGPELDALLEQALTIGPGKLLVLDRGKRELRRKRQEYVDLDAMNPQERLGALCRSAEQMGVLPCG